MDFLGTKPGKPGEPDQVQKLSHREEKRLADLHASNCHLTESEEEHIVGICTMLGRFGYPVDEDTILDVINTTMLKRMESQGLDTAEFKPSTLSIIRNILRKEKYEDLCKMVSSSSLDPQRSKQATEMTRDSFFAKIDIYMKFLHEMGVMDKDSFAELEDYRKYNMDEVGTDTTKRTKKKVLGYTKEFARVFQNTSEGDGKMPFHVSMCICLQADGE